MLPPSERLQQSNGIILNRRMRDVWTGFSSALNYTLILCQSFSGPSGFTHALKAVLLNAPGWRRKWCFHPSIPGKKKNRVPSTTKSAILCLLHRFVCECLQMSVDTCTLLATHKHIPSIKSSMYLLKCKKECYCTANCCRIQTQASTHWLPYRTSVCTKLIHAEFARITSSHLTGEYYTQTWLIRAKMYALFFFTHTHCYCYNVWQLNIKGLSCPTIHGSKSTSLSHMRAWHEPKVRTCLVDAGVLSAVSCCWKRGGYISFVKWS